MLAAETDDQREQLRKLLDSAFRALRLDATRVRFDFSRTVKLYPGGTLILLAYLELLLELYPGRVSARCVPHSLAAQLLRHFGVADKLGIDRAASVPRHESVVRWQYLTGTVADGQKVAELINFYRDQISADIPDGLYDVLTEALTNVRHHAYPDDDADVPEPLRRWWLFARYEEPQNGRPGYLYIGVYDIGVGIQTSMRNKLRSGEVVLDATDELLGLLGLPRSKLLERLLLERAVEHPRSSTGLPFRGRGLPEMRDFVLATERGRLYIISGQAQYACVSGKGPSTTYPCVNRFMGTLILWSIALQHKEPQQ